MKRLIFALALAIVVMMQTGCGTMCSHIGNGMSRTFCGTNDKLGIYPGVRFDAQAVWTAPVRTIDGEPAALLFAPLCFADVPLSAVADTCLLPCDIKEDRR
jgi:uncharacterized protein YceK